MKNFRNYRSAQIELEAGLSLIVGSNGAGKTNLLEAAQFVTCGRSFRTSREAEMICQQSDFLRLEAEVKRNGISNLRAVSYMSGAPSKVDAGGGSKWLSTGSVLCFSPDDLQLIKGPPANRRRFLDDLIARRWPVHQRLILDYQRVLSQRNSFLQRAKAGFVPLADISPWDRQLAILAQQIFQARLNFCQVLSPHFHTAYGEISAATDGAEIRYLSQLSDLQSGSVEQSIELRLRDGWLMDLERTSTNFGTHRDDVEFRLGKKNLKPFGSQGEQRAAVLALLLADCRLAAYEKNDLPLILLDDVMSELDPARRRRLMCTLSQQGQVLITAADKDLFSLEELESAHLFRVSNGQIQKEIKV